MMMPSDQAAAKLIADESEIDASIDNDEPTSKELVEMLREKSVHQANAGNTRPASEVMRELREMLAEDGRRQLTMLTDTVCLATNMRLCLTPY